MKERVLRTLEAIAETARSAELTELECRRAVRNLEQVHERLRRREYEKSSFDQNVFDIPGRMQQLFTEVDFYCAVGRTWAAAFREVGIARCGRVLDLCPGVAPKIELALFYLGYSGEVVILDKDAKASADLLRFMALFDPQFKLVTRTEDVFLAELEPFAVVVGNHIIDDLVLHEYCRHTGIEPSELYTQEGLLVRTWAAIVADERSLFDSTQAKLTRLLSSVTAPGGWLLLAQYASYMERSLDLQHATDFCRRLLGAVTRDLVQAEFVDESARVRAALDRQGPIFSSAACFALRKRPGPKLSFG